MGVTGMMVQWMVEILRVLIILTMVVFVAQAVVEVKEDVECGKIEDEGEEEALELLETGIRITEAREMILRDSGNGIQKQTNQIKNREKTNVKSEDVRERAGGEIQKKSRRTSTIQGSTPRTLPALLLEMILAMSTWIKTMMLRPMR